MSLGNLGRPQVICAHSNTVVITVAGLERTVCEECGQVTMNLVSELVNPVERVKFAREADALARRRDAISG